ncbi:hypothetical protein [Pseudomonas oryzihabitans]|uniref:hypothetical protein n=1 Tax=Pseudomonas oryzihabitans TaxID=47885 RepID=UPI00135DF904|nr:hypothetical protein [Pseudomonas oryzihabitans]MXS19265.1 hypothetical protein [Pseudomonas oryzihabitans]
MDAKTLENNIFETLANEGELLSLVVKCHYSIDKILDIALKGSLPQADALELNRVSLLLKVDFLTALGGLRPQTRKLFEIVNSTRNRFAHNPYATFSVDDAKKCHSAIIEHSPPLTPQEFLKAEDPLYILKILFSVCFLQAAVSYENSCRRKIENQIAIEMTQEALRKREHEINERPIMDEFRVRCEAELKQQYPYIEPSSKCSIVGK